MRTLLLLALLPLAACEGEFTYDVDTGEPGGTDIQSEVQAYLENDGIDVASISCDAVASDASAEVGAVTGTYLCTVEQPVGEDFLLDAETVNAVEPDGTPSVTWSGTTRNVVIVPEIEGKLAAQFSEVSGLPLDVTCDTPRVLPSVPGDTFSCALTGGENEQEVLITVSNDTGGIDYKVSG